MYLDFQSFWKGSSLNTLERTISPLKGVVWVLFFFCGITKEKLGNKRWFKISDFKVKSYPQYTPGITAETQILELHIQNLKQWGDNFFQSLKLFRFVKQTDQELSDNNERPGNGMTGTTWWWLI